MTTFQYNQPPQKLFSIDASTVESAQGTISLHSGSEEMLRVAKDGFYIRGVKIEQDANEAQQVYESFKQWLTWAQLNKV